MVQPAESPARSPPLPPPAAALLPPPPPPAAAMPPPPAATKAPAPEEQEEMPRPAFLPPQPPADSAELLPESWRAALTVEQQQWIGRVLFSRDSRGRSRLITELNLWHHPPQTRPVYNQPPASPDPFFACRLFLWMPHRIWHLQLTCPQPLCTGTMTKAGLYRTIRRVLDINGWYLMATEYLECRRCKKKVVGWSQGIIRQLSPTYSCQFPAILTYRLSCDLRVVAQLRSRTLGNGANRLFNTLRENHSNAWMRRAIQYLGVCEQFLALCSVRGQFPPPPQMPPLPSPIWLLTVYSYDVLTRLDEYKARITSTFGSILKMDSTKKASVTTETHELYPPFMRQLSHCIFEVDPRDARRLIEAKRSQLEGRHGMVAPTDAEVIKKISKKEWRLHCRRRTRGPEESTLLIQELLDTFGGPAGRNTLDVPLLNALRIQDIWSTQRAHPSCIQDPPGVQLYTQTGRLTKGGVSLPVYCCARGSTSLESFHLNRFIPGTRESAKHFQTFLVDGLARWNEDRAAPAAEGQEGPLHSYSAPQAHP
ncbi:uncharacterized protein LOC119498907 [Sebastes umbrosus]|uniref:uncharacterized protein LOC119498907 n=1 Tax=Sebastes umbrosus TaxID=72105 RepID=UPI00189E6BBF|nr:uncharacterized protein LOC119498907 [Sebastes umbrosus]